MAYHAQLSPSSAARWTSCSASVAAQLGLTDGGSEAARLGTTGHQLAAECLERSLDTQTYLHRRMGFHSGGEDWSDLLPDAVVILHSVVVDQVMIDAVQVYVSYICEQIELSGSTLHIEQRVPIGHITGEPGAGGTSDAVIVGKTTLTTIDLKLGRSKVTAFDVITPAGQDILTGEPTDPVVRINLQLAFYLLGALKKYPGAYTHVTAIIVQPHLTHVSEYTCSVPDLLAVGDWLLSCADATRSNPVFVPTQDNCHFCKAAGQCAAQTQAVLTTALLGFDDVDTAHPVPVTGTGNRLGSLYAAVPMIQAWCKQVSEHTLNELLAGRQVMRNDGLQYKLVLGKKGNRQFADAQVAEALMRTMRLKAEHMYTRHLITASAAEKLSLPTKCGKTVIAPAVISARAWLRLAAHITQSDGMPCVALETDHRPAIASSVAGFDDIAADPVTLFDAELLALVPPDCLDLFS